METKVDAHIVRDPNGVCRVMVKRAKYKHWFELGQHAATDVAFEQALAAGTVCGIQRLWTGPNFFEKILLFSLVIKKLTLYLHCDCAVV